MPLEVMEETNSFFMNAAIDPNTSFFNNYMANRDHAKRIAEKLKISKLPVNIFGIDIEVDVLGQSPEDIRKTNEYKERYKSLKIEELNSAGIKNPDTYEQINELYESFKEYHGLEHKIDVAAIAATVYQSLCLENADDRSIMEILVGGLLHDEGRLDDHADIWVEDGNMGYYHNHSEIGQLMWSAAARYYVCEGIIDECSVEVISDIILKHSDTYTSLKNEYRGKNHPILFVKFGDRVTKTGYSGTAGSIQFALNHSMLFYLPRSLSSALLGRMKRMTDFSNNVVYLKEEVKKTYEEVKLYEREIINKFREMWRNHPEIPHTPQHSAGLRDVFD